MNSVVAVLVLAAVGAGLLTVLAGLLVYRNTRRLISGADWVQHTQEVLTAIQRASMWNERIEYRTRLYRLTGEEEQLNRARSSANLLENSVITLRVLVADNPYQVTNVESLGICSQNLSRVVNTFNMQSTVPELPIQRCQQTINRMLDEEQSRLKERTAVRQQSSLASTIGEFGYVGLSLVGLVVLFGFLLRDAVLRQRVGRQMLLTNERLASSVNALEDKANESALLTFSRDELQLCVDVSQVYESAARSFLRLLPMSSGSLCIINNSRQLVEVVSSWGVAALEDFNPPESCCGLRSGQPRWRQPGVSEIHCTHFVGHLPERYLCLPIVAHGNTLGVLYVQCNTDEDVAAVNARLDGLRQLLQLTGMAVASLNLRTKLESQSIRDSLTGLFNRHFMQISLERELARAARRKQTLAVFMLDVDHFKRFNDTHGHAAGDTALQAIADLFRTNIRTDDIACRYGGEEFTIILPDVSGATAYDRAETVRKSVTSLKVPLEDETYGEFSLSIGIALYPSDGETADLLLRRADQALYRAKRGGRNQVVVYEAGSAVAVQS
ncbi:sensor domain-containing diguanylate cyclase [Acidicapsa ligni]|uniref:sensor domain-containing diguanylate cyclase n=1 Tax=Acidicapsa ligni TaxID=542300 RepID=UPI0021DFBB94|nr:diguanylate cyclase [Acidicapsa ligni]